LDDIPGKQLDGLKHLGFDWIYLLGVWQTGAAGREVSRSNPEWRNEYEALLGDLQEGDICGSCFAVAGYTVHEALGGDRALGRLRERLHRRGMKVMLDFVPNHTAPDHPWTHAYPDFYVGGTEADLEHEPHNYMATHATDARQILAYGRDPYFAGWPDTLQLNYGNPALQEAVRGELLKVAKLCDGLRCDMAMLILPDVFRRTWGIETEPFWPEAIRRVREEKPGFVFMAEVYWDMEWTLQQQGFDYTYDKRLYDRLCDRHARAVREHFWAEADYQNKSARFLENHDEYRASAVFPVGIHQAAALLTYLCPGLRFFHHGQLEGWDQKIPIHLCRGPDQPGNPTIQEFYQKLLDFLNLPVQRNGSWQLLDCTAAHDGNLTADDMIAFAWQGSEGARSLVVVNYAPQPGQCYVRLPFAEMEGQLIQLEGRLCTPIMSERAAVYLQKDSTWICRPGVTMFLRLL
jgi:glycosidase